LNESARNWCTAPIRLVEPPVDLDATECAHRRQPPIFVRQDLTGCRRCRTVKDSAKNESD